VKNSFSLSYVLGMIKNIIGAMDKPKDRLHYFNSLMDMFRELILDIHEFADQGKWTTDKEYTPISIPIKSSDILGT
jgi:hypothetical protein